MILDPTRSRKCLYCKTSFIPEHRDGQLYCSPRHRERQNYEEAKKRMYEASRPKPLHLLPPSERRRMDTITRYVHIKISLEAGISQTEIAEELGISKQRVHQIITRLKILHLL